MFEMKLSDLVSDIKEQVIPRGQDNKKALYLCFDVGLRVYGPEYIEAGRRSLVHILLYCPYGGSVHTFVAEKSFGPYGPVSKLEWENTSNHDSCWRSDGVDSPLSRIYFRMADEINKELKDSGHEPMAPVKMSQSCHFNMIGESWRLVDVKLSRENRETYRHTIEILSEV
jgi:hypothetical protein